MSMGIQSYLALDNVKSTSVVQLKITKRAKKQENTTQYGGGGINQSNLPQNDTDVRISRQEY